MRKDVKKILFLGLNQDKAPFFEAAQKLGLIQFLEEKVPVDSKLEVLTQSLRILRGLPPQNGVPIVTRQEAYSISQQIIAFQNQLDAAHERLKNITLEIEKVEPFGHFDLEEFAKIGLHFQFFCAKKKGDVAEGLLLINSDLNLDYYLWIGKELLSNPKMVEIKIEQSLPDLIQRKHQIEKEKHLVEQKLQTLAQYSQALHHALLQEMDAFHLQVAEKGAKTAFDEQLFIASGWIPEDQFPAIVELCQAFSVHFEEIAIEPDDPVPTCLENDNLSRIGEDLVHIYDTPSTTDKDPSLWVFSAFLVFFSIIIGDGGYGAVFLGLALYLRYKFPALKGAEKRALNLFTFLCVGCITWGVLTSSFFGVSLEPENPLRRFSLTTYLAEKKVEYHVHQEGDLYGSWLMTYPEIQGLKHAGEILAKGVVHKDGQPAYQLLASLTDEILMELALFIGVIHLILGMVRYLRKNWSLFGWIIFLMGAYLYFPLFLGTPSLLNYVFHIPFEAGGAVGLQLIYTGIISAVSIAVFRNGILGLTEVMNVIQVFADALSYLRLYALGLSGAILSATINDMASKMPFLFAIVLIGTGHIVNMVLAIMGGVIHGLRLNFLEWYHYSFEGGGRQFKPLKLQVQPEGEQL